MPCRLLAAPLQTPQRRNNAALLRCSPIRPSRSSAAAAAPPLPPPPTNHPERARSPAAARQLQAHVLQPFPLPRSVLVLDNCSIHKNQEFLDIIEEIGAMILWLPPLSPDFNPARRGAPAPRSPKFKRNKRALPGGPTRMMHHASG